MWFSKFWAASRIWVIMSGVVIALSTATYFIGHAQGAADCEAKTAKANNTVLVKEKTGDAKRDRAAPVVSNRASQLNWLRQYTSPQQ